MFRPLALAAAILLPLSSASAQSLTERLAADGLAATESRLASLSAPSPDDRFALGGVRFLRSIERALQLRYRYGISPDLDMLPVLRLPIPPNPAPETFDPAAIDRLFAEIEGDMAGAIAALDTIADDDDVGVIVDIGDLWLDIDGSGTAGPGESLPEIIGWTLGMPLNDTLPPPEIRFDTADAAWLSAYAHQITAWSHIVRALSPTAAITEVLASAAEFDRINSEVGGFAARDAQFGTFIDLAAIVLGAIEQRPHPAHSRAALDHLQQMTADNRVFWARVSAETDNDREWIPNDRQTSVLGLEFPAGTAQSWQAVLKEIELVLRGERLLPYWRLGDGAGLNLRAILEDPPEIDIIALIQGSALLPYVETGPLMSGEAFRRFDQLVQGQSVLFAIVLN
ncbi:hypothetical protein [Histidinibacterium lentulum]|uniref:DUF2066 domain-containing protein n=1 Tax=Histidinibacterium lentulum TaxID=2480588 RepID=A0A3N2R1E6_9RHOB|nr:hypothetical protein [Histidinibacterium lentulum]ROU01158.1 hypothetical protein EAT49_11590 [Histidinibacterium lentulum]